LDHPALSVVKGVLYVPFGSSGDCGDYHGWVVAVPLDRTRAPTGWAVPAEGGGIWAPSGVSSDGESIFAATGNTDADEWAGGEAVLRFPAGIDMPSAASDYFAAADWKELDENDLDLGGSGALLVDVPGGEPEHLVVALGKDGFAYLLDAAHLGGMTEDDTQIVAKAQIMTHNIVTSAATFATSQGAVVVMDGQTDGVGVSCPYGQSGDLVAMLITPGTPPTVSTLWCANNEGHGSPAVSTTDGSADPIVWITSDAAGALHGYNALTGDQVFSNDGDAIPKLHRFSTVLIAAGRIYAAGDDRLYAFVP
jgi:hypothetical protein